MIFMYQINFTDELDGYGPDGIDDDEFGDMELVQSSYIFLIFIWIFLIMLCNLLDKPWEK